MRIKGRRVIGVVIPGLDWITLTPVHWEGRRLVADGYPQQTFSVELLSDDPTPCPWGRVAARIIEFWEGDPVYWVMGQLQLEEE